MAETQGQGKTLEEIKASAKQMVKTPEDFNAMHQQILFFEGACKIFLGPHSCGTKSISHLAALLTRYKQHFKTAAVSDKLFPTKFLYAVDISFQRWLCECRDSLDRSEVADYIINYNSLVGDVLNNRFMVNLPASFKTTDDKELFSLQESTSSKKRNLNVTDGDTNKKKDVQNNDQNPDFKMLPGEDWKKVFCGRCIQDRVKWDERSHMCPRWHSKGMCFTNCHHIASHVAKDKVPEQKRAEYSKFLKKLRKE